MIKMTLTNLHQENSTAEASFLKLFDSLPRTLLEVIHIVFIVSSIAIIFIKGCGKY